MSCPLAARIPSAATDPRALPRRPRDQRWPPTAPLVIVGPLLFVTLLNGSIIVETVFGWPGLGLLVVEAVDSPDYPLVQAVVRCLPAMYIGVNLLVDVLYAYLNPMTRYSR